MARPRSSIERKPLNTKIDIALFQLLKKINSDTGIPINRLIEDALKEKYLKNKE
ncbi:MAG: ribbon-helix-helix domain-containing protein [Fusobacteriaceae bacterium]